MPDVVDYDKGSCDYESYWIERRYEDQAERFALKKMISCIPQLRRNVIADLGGGYGRLLHVYYPYYKHIFLVDYSLNHLRKAVCFHKDKANIVYLAANVYHLPFADGSIDTTLMVRVLHHIEDVKCLIKELSRVAKFNLILDCPNKRHFLNVVRSILTCSIGNTMSYEPYSQPARKKDALKRQVKQIFYNYHPKWVESIALKVGLRVQKSLSVSNFRNPIIKKIIPLSVLNFLERNLQSLLAPFLFGPNIWMLFTKTQPFCLTCKDQSKEQKYKSNFSSGCKMLRYPQCLKPTFLVESLCSIVVCPKCYGRLEFEAEFTWCKKCHTKYKLIDGKIWDFRVR